MNATTGFWYHFFDVPAVYNSVRSVLLFGKKKMYLEIQNAVALQEGESILDVGSGPGELSQLFSGDYVGMDYSENYVSYAEKKYLGKKFSQGNVLLLDIPEKSYDVVLLASFIHHFDDTEVQTILRNVAMVARKRVVILEPCPWKGNPVAWFLLNMDRGAHVREFTVQREFIEKYFIVEKESFFYSGLYKLSLFVGTPKS